MKHYKIIISFVILLSCIINNSSAQDVKRIAELQQDFKTAITDSAKITALTKLADKYANTSIDSTLKYANKAIALCLKVKLPTGLAYSYNSIGDVYWYKGNYAKAQEYYFQSYKVSDSINDKQSMSLALYSMGWIFCVQQHDLSKLNYLYKAKSLAIEINDKKAEFNSIDALASTYLECFKKDIKQKQYYDSALYYCELQKYFFNNIENAKEFYYYNLLQLQYSANDFKSAIFYGGKANQFIKEVNKDDHYKIDIYILLSEINLNKIDKAVLNKLNIMFGYFIAKENKPKITECLKGFALFYYKNKDYKKAYEYGMKYYTLNTELENSIYNSNLASLTGNYQENKTQNKLDELEKAKELEEQKNKTKNYLLIAVLAGIITVLGFAYSLFKQNKLKHTANKLLETKNHIIAEKISEIDKSIQYAKGIQMSVLPSVEDLSSQFEHSFVYYVPKDVVSGDFYWFAKTNDYFYCVVADCTGHGVPGAFMSMIGMSKLTQAIFQNKLSNPSDILSFLNIEIKHDLKQYAMENKQKDGMDLLLLKFHNNNHSVVEYCAANRPLILIRNKELTEYKADKAAIGGFTPDDQYYATISITLLTGDSLYLFTDGYADQFGGGEGKKFMSKQLKQLLLNIHSLSSTNQHQQLEEAFHNWKKEYEQVDDVLVIGITI